MNPRMLLYMQPHFCVPTAIHCHAIYCVEQFAQVEVMVGQLDGSPSMVLMAEGLGLLDSQQNFGSKPVSRLKKHPLLAWPCVLCVPWFVAGGPRTRHGVDVHLAECGCVVRL